MCKVHNQVGCLTFVKSYLHKHNLTEFSSINELIAFQNCYGAKRQQFLTNSAAVIENEKTKLLSDSHELRASIEFYKASINKELLGQLETYNAQLQELSNSENSWKAIVNSFKYVFLERKIRRKENDIQSSVLRSVQHLVKTLERNENRYNYINSKFEDAVIDHCAKELQALVRKKNLIDEINSSIYGAIGEQRVSNELGKLPDDYILINDFCLSFNPPIYNKKENDRITSIQADHLLITPSGLFLIETKNWSEESMNNLDLRSPVSQLKRTSYALFTLLNSDASFLNHHHWGKKKIPIKNLLVLMNRKPQEEFQFVKVLTLNQLLGYIKYFPPLFTAVEIERIAEELIRISGK
jgi:hypothetical protein